MDTMEVAIHGMEPRSRLPDRRSIPPLLRALPVGLRYCNPVRSPLRVQSSKQPLIEEKPMISFRAIVTISLAAALVFACPEANAQDTNSAAGIQQKLAAQFPLTKATADRTDIVTAGAVLVLEKDNLLMYTVTTTLPASNTYKNGKISNVSIPKCTFCSYVPGLSSAAAQIPNVDSRKFVAGEKFWVTKIDVHDDGVVFNLFSDPYSDVRYYATLKFPFAKGVTPPTDQVMSTVAEVLKVQPADDSGGSGGGAEQPQPPAPASQTAQASQQGGQPALTPIAPPPPPPDAAPAAPKTIAKGQTKDQVLVIFGQPTKVVKLGAKEIDIYPDMKVTFMDNKVADVQ